MSSAWQNRINKLAADVEPSIIAESARWGDAGINSNSIAYTKQDWLGAQNDLLDYLTPRTAIILAQLRADNLYPNLDAPSLNPYGGHQPSGKFVASGNIQSKLAANRHGHHDRKDSNQTCPGSIPRP